MSDKRSLFQRPAFVVAIAAILMVGGAGLAAAATPGTFDNETTDSPETSGVQDGVVLDSTFNASGSATYNVTMVDANSSNLVVNITKNATGTEYYNFSGDWTVLNSSQGNYQHNFTGADLAKVPMAINESVEMDVTVWEEGDKANATTATVTINNTAERSVHAVDTGALGDNGFAEINEDDGWIPGGDTVDHLAVDQEGVKVNGSETTVIYTLPATNASDAVANATSEFSSSGTWTMMKATVATDDKTVHVPVFYDSAPDSWSVSEDGSYAVYDPDANTYSYTLSESQFGDASKVDTTFTTKTYSVFDVTTVFQAFGAGFVWDLTATKANPLSVGFGAGAVSLGLIIPITTRKIGA